MKNIQILLPTTVSISQTVITKDNDVIPMSIFVKYEPTKLDHLLEQLPDYMKELPLDYYCYDLCYEHTLLYVPLHEMLPKDVIDKICSTVDTLCIRLYNAMLIIARVTYVKKKYNNVVISVNIEPELDIA